MKKNILIILNLLAIAFSSFGQTTKPELITDRPDQTEAPNLIPAGGLQVETGFVYEKDRSFDISTTNYAYNTTLIRYGVNQFIELRLISEYLGEHVRVSESQTTKVKGFSPLALGVKIKVAEEKGFWPQAAFIGHLTPKTVSNPRNDGR